MTSVYDLDERDETIPLLCGLAKAVRQEHEKAMVSAYSQDFDLHAYTARRQQDIAAELMAVDRKVTVHLPARELDDLPEIFTGEGWTAKVFWKNTALHYHTVQLTADEQGEALFRRDVLMLRMSGHV